MDEVSAQVSPPPPQPQPLVIVTGAPGSGKSTTVRALLAQRTDFLVLDADRLLDAVSELCGRSVAVESILCPPYRIVWLTFLQLIAENGRLPVLFMPLEPRELPPSWRASVRWCLLDCTDSIRSARLQARGWQASVIEEALADAVALRQQIAAVIDTSRLEPEAVATTIAAWVALSSAS